MAEQNWARRVVDSRGSHFRIERVVVQDKEKTVLNQSKLSHRMIMVRYF